MESCGAAVVFGVDRHGNLLRELSSGVLSNPALSASLGRSAADRVRCHYQLDRTIERYLAMYGALVNSRRRG